MAHDYHDGLPGYSKAQILHDGCAECEARAKRDDHGIGSLDQQNFARAWRRAADWNTQIADRHERPVAKAEAPLLNALWAVQLQLERRGVPIGEVPYG
jgi:hypothetical protein